MAVGNAAVGEGLDHVGGEAERRAPGAVIGECLAIRLDDHGEEVAADAGRHRLDHAKDGVGGDRRIDRRAAAIDDSERGPGGDRMAGGDHARLAANAGGRGGGLAVQDIGLRERNAARDAKMSPGLRVPQDRQPRKFTHPSHSVLF